MKIPRVPWLSMMLSENLKKKVRAISAGLNAQTPRHKCWPERKPGPTLCKGICFNPPKKESRTSRKVEQQCTVAFYELWLINQSTPPNVFPSSVFLKGFHNRPKKGNQWLICHNLFGAKKQMPGTKYPIVWSDKQNTSRNPPVTSAPTVSPTIRFPGNKFWMIKGKHGNSRVPVFFWQLFQFQSQKPKNFQKDGMHMRNIPNKKKQGANHQKTLLEFGLFDHAWFGHKPQGWFSDPHGLRDPGIHGICQAEDIGQLAGSIACNSNQVMLHELLIPHLSWWKAWNRMTCPCPDGWNKIQ